MRIHKGYSTTLEVGQLYGAMQDTSLVCPHCGISRPTLRKWVRRYRAEGEAGLPAHLH